MPTPSTTILIPTYNRPKELYRLLKFLTFMHNPFPIVILDGSLMENQLLNRKIVNQFPNVICPDFPPGLHLGIRLAKGLQEYARTPYVVFCPDDDFVIPEGIASCAAYFDEHPEFSAINGLVKCLAYPKKLNRLGIFTFIDHLKHPLILTEPSFLSRFLKFIAYSDAGCPPLFYALRRREQAAEIFAKIHANFKFSSQEMLCNALTLMWGKTITLPTLLLIRNYSSETTRDEIREDPLTTLTLDDALYIREILKAELKKDPQALSDEMISYTLDQFLKLPLEKVTQKYVMAQSSTPLARWVAYKKNWLFYLIHYLIPSFSEKFDITMNKKVILALRKAFQTKASFLYER